MANTQKTQHIFLAFRLLAKSHQCLFALPDLLGNILYGILYSILFANLIDILISTINFPAIQIQAEQIILDDQLRLF